jgi:hypothetical protein
MRLQLGKFSRAFSLLVLPLLTSAVASAGVTVSVSSPAAGSTVSSPTTIKASASSANRITGWYIYVDGKATWNTGAATSISAPISLSAGTHSIYVRAWDSSGAFGTSSTFYLTASGSSSGVNVNVTSPAPGATVGSPTTISANASSGYPITGWHIYVDSVSVWSAGSTQTINASVNIPSGTHSVYVRAWNSSGAFGTSSTFTLTNNGGTPSASSTGEPMPPSSAKLLDNIDQLTGWGHCTDCAADPSDPTPPIALWSFTQNQSTPSKDGSSAKMWIGGNTPYANALHWKKFGDQSAYKNFIWEFWIYGNSDMNNAQNLEFDLFQAVSGRKYMFGTQCNYNKKIWQGWDETTNHWIDMTNVPCPKFATGQWNRIKWYFQRTSDNRLHYVSVTVNSTTYKVDRYWNSYPTGWGNTFGVQFQQDLNSSAADYTVWADKVKVWMW